MPSEFFDHEAERAILGSIFLDPCLFADVELEQITADSFHNKPYGMIFAAMRLATAEGKEICYESVWAGIKNVGGEKSVGGAVVLSTLISDTVTSANLDTYCQIVVDHEIRRRVFEAASRIQDMTRVQPDSRVCVSRAAELLQRATSGFLFDGGQKFIGDTYDEDCRCLLDDSEPRGMVRTGIDVIDQGFGGLYPMLNVLASRPSMGKSTLALNIAVNAASAGKRVLLISMEDTARIVTWRIISRLARVPIDQMFHKKFLPDEPRRISEIGNYIKTLPLAIEDNSSLTSAQIRDLCITHQAKHGCDLVVIDHLGHINEPGRNLYESTSHACRSIARIPGELGVPVLLLHQLNRGAASDTGNLPRLENLRQSGEVEQLARVVWLLHRPHYYDETKDENEMALIVAKNSHGKTTKKKLWCDLQYMDIRRTTPSDQVDY